MPELPEVQTTLSGVEPYLQGQVINQLIVRDRRLRWPVPVGLEQLVAGQSVAYLERRGKYILIGLQQGGLLVHLGMSGSMRVVLDSAPPQKHDHFDLVTETGAIIRFHDPRRFGCLLWDPVDIRQHIRLENLGVEPLETEFDGALLHQAAGARKVAVKNLIMNSEIVVGVGNIYASESLFDAGIHPHRSCNRISLSRYQRLAGSIRKILQRSIDQGGTTLRDFVSAEGKPGYFVQQLMVYDRRDEPCKVCSKEIKKVVTAQRATYYCPSCQR